jgi:hypothetical protein
LKAHSYPQRLHTQLKVNFGLLSLVAFKLIGRKATFTREIANFNHKIHAIAFIFIFFLLGFFLSIGKINFFYSYLRIGINQPAKFKQPLNR